MFSILTIAGKNLLRYQRRTLLTALLITIGIVAVLLFIALSSSFRDMMVGQITGSTFVDTKDAHQWLLGLRYLTESDTTYILEYYHNGAGYSDSQLQEYYRNVRSAAVSDNLPL